MLTPSLLSSLARSILAGELTRDSIVERASQTLGKDWPWLTEVARRYLTAFASATRPRHHQVVKFLLSDPVFRRGASRHASELTVKKWLTEPQLMQPVSAAASWNLPAIETAGALADWLQVTVGKLEWFADLKGLTSCGGRVPLQHYRYRILRKSSGNVRLIEAPKPKLAALQRKILVDILEAIPIHPAAHGFRKGHSIKTFVAPHLGRRVVLRMDLLNFFPAISGPRVQAFFRTAGYPESVADLLGGLCTNAAPVEVWNAASLDINSKKVGEAKELYSRPHLPQGAPTSPALANLCGYRLDCRFCGLAKSAGVSYTRYADDIVFSGGDKFAQQAEGFSTEIATIAHEEGFAVHHRKTRIMRQSVRQHVAGLVVNQYANIRRDEFDRLKATLTNCLSFGPESQNRDGHSQFRAHLRGRIAFVEMINPNRGRRLQDIFQKINWPPGF